VNENLVECFSQEVQVPEARCFYGFQIAIEVRKSCDTAVNRENIVKMKSSDLPYKHTTFISQKY